jgi:hypothetical protein
MTTTTMEWTRAKVGAYWFSGEYAIATVSGGESVRNGYKLWYQCQQFGGRFPTLADAQQVAERHALTSRV